MLLFKPEGDLLAATLALVGLWFCLRGLFVFLALSETGLTNSMFKILVYDYFF